MKKNKIIDFELKKYEIDLIDMVRIVGLDRFKQKPLAITLTLEERQLLIKCTKTAIDLLEGLRSDKEIFEETYLKQQELLEKLDGPDYKNLNLLLPASQHDQPLLSLEIGGNINQDSKFNENNNSNLWNDKEYNQLVKLYENILSKYKIVVKIINPFDIPEHLRN